MDSNGGRHNTTNGSSATVTGSQQVVKPYLSSKSKAKQQPLDDPGEIVAQAETVDGPATEPPNKTRQKQRRRRLVFGGILSLIILGIVGAAWILLARKSNQVEYHVADERNARPSQPANSIPPGVEQSINEANKEIKGPAAHPTPSPTPSPGTLKETNPQSNLPQVPLEVPGGLAGTATDKEQLGVKNPVTGFPTTTNPAADRSTTQSPTATATPPNPSSISKRNTQRSIYMTDAVATATAPASPSSTAYSPPPPVNSPRSQPKREPESTFPLPNFGSVLPVKTIGELHTLRSGSLQQMELTRDVAGPGWQLHRGTILVGTLRGGEYDRAFLTLIGFIDPASGRLVRVEGDVLGADGASGLRGERKRMDNRFARFLKQGFDSAIQLTQAALSNRNGSTTVLLPGVQNTVGSDLGQLSRTANRREFVKVEAGATAYVMITDLPGEIKGVDALARMNGDELKRTLDGSQITATGLSEQELAELLATGSVQQLQDALPRMTPQMRLIVEKMIEQGGHQ